MHSALNRLQTTFSSFTTYASILASLLALLSLLTTPVPAIPAGGLTLHNVQTVKGRPHYYSTRKEEYAHLKFSLDADLAPLFTWNTKQVFVYVVASYPPSAAAAAQGAQWSESVVWDAVLKHPLQPAHHNQYVYAEQRRKAKGKRLEKLAAPHPPGRLELKGQRPKYQITDPSGRIAGVANATLSLHYNVQPWVGALVWGGPAPRGDAPARVARSVREKLGAQADALMALVPGWLRGITSATLGDGARSAAFDFPELKERSAAAKEAGGSLNVERGGERRAGEFF